MNNSPDDLELREKLASLQERVSDDDLEDRLSGMLEQLTDAPARPAAAKLSTDQARVIVWLLDGFDDREEMLSWMQSLVIQSLGALEDDWYADVASSSVLVSAMLDRPWGTMREDFDDLPPNFAAELRRGVVVEDLLPAFRQAHRDFRWSAGERVEFLDEESENDDAIRVDPREQQYPAMRPSLGQLAERMEWALSKLLEGFENPDALLLWVQSVTAIVHAEVDEEAIQGAYFETPVRDHLLGEGDEAEFFRTAWAAEFLLPAFNRAAREVAERAGEVIAGEQEADQSVPGWS